MGLIRPNFMIARVLPQIFFVGSDSTGDAGSTTATYTNFNIGAAHPNRRVFVVSLSYNQDSPPTLTSATIGGTGATIHVNGGANSMSIFSAARPTGTTATIVLNHDDDIDESRIGVYRVINLSSATATDTDTDTGTGTLSCALDVLEGGFALAGCLFGSFTGGVSLDVTNNIAIGSARYLAKQTNRAITASAPGKGGGDLVCASFR